MKTIPLTLKQANEFIAKHHRHHKPVQGHRFSIGCTDKDDKLIGVCICGRPVARKIDWTTILEITRLATDGSFNACSYLYGGAARVAKEMGFLKIQTYILGTESGVSLKASGFVCADSHCGGGQWVHSDGRKRRTDQPTMYKQRWEKVLHQKAWVQHTEKTVGIVAVRQDKNFISIELNPEIENELIQTKLEL